MARLPCMELRGMENSTRGGVYSIVVQISIRKMTMIGLHCSMRCSTDMWSLLECCSNTGQRLMHGVCSGPLHCTRRYEEEKFKSCDYFWSTAQTSMRMIIEAGHLSGGSQS